MVPDKQSNPEGQVFLGVTYVVGLRRAVASVVCSYSVAVSLCKYPANTTDITTTNLPAEGQRNYLADSRGESTTVPALSA